MENLVAQAKKWWQEHGRIVLVLSVAALAALLEYNAYKNKREQDELASWEALSRLPPSTYLLMLPEEQSEQERARIIEECQSILDSQPTTTATPWVLLKLANAHYQSGRLSEAQESYRRVLEKYPRSAAAGMAGPALAAALEDGAQHARAAELFEELAARQGSNLLYWLDAARNRELAGQVELARKHYQAFVQAAGEEYPQFATLAQHRLKSLENGQLLSVPPAPEPWTEPEGLEAEGEAGPEATSEEGPGAEGTPAEGTPSDRDVEAAPEGETEPPIEPAPEGEITPQPHDPDSKR
ncbi:MAG: tetratricopeptide repeat protein [Candidatus Brocadiae bacterium]|nr:tetratricopeptide repeat protein [Candidatus Brocadiia bacterium]